MADIFISYAGPDRERARVLADALARLGYSVWSDATIPPGRAVDEAIQEALQAAKCVVVLWSAESVKSDSVKTGAAEGLAHGRLVCALIEAVSPPIDFMRIETADLSDWSGAADDPAFRKLLAAVDRLLQARPRPGSAASRPPPAPATPPSKLTLLKIMTIVGLVGIVATVAMRWMGERMKQEAARDPQSQSVVPGQPQAAPPSTTRTPSAPRPPSDGATQ